MEPPNKTWSDIIRQANLTPDILKQTEVLKNVQNILATNVSVCSSLGPPFASQMSHIYIDMLTVYRRAAAPGQSHAAHLKHLSTTAAFLFCVGFLRLASSRNVVDKACSNDMLRCNVAVMLA